MPATSKAQQKAAGAALAAKRGETSRAQLEEASREMYDSMTVEELEELASTPISDLPDHVAEKSADMGHGDQLRHQQQQNQDRRQNQTHGQDGKKDKNAQNNQGNRDQNDPRRLKEDEESEDDFGNKHADRVPDTTRNPAPEEQRNFGNEDRTNREIGTENMPDPIEVDREGNARRSKDEA